MNKKINLLMLAGMIVLGNVTAALALPYVQNTPRNQRGEEPNPYFFGYQNSRVAGATTELVICSGRCVLVATILGTGPATSELRIRNTSVADGDTNRISIKHRFLVQNSEPGNNPIRLPLLMQNGITAQLTAASSQEEAVIVYLDIDD